MASTADRVRIHYRRLPDREEVFEQFVLERTDTCIVTFQESTRLGRTIRIGGEVVLENGSPAIWFTFPDAWHDIGRFHRADGTFTGIYGNVLTPVVLHGNEQWATTDLFLDIWLGKDGQIRILDEDELDHARQAGWIDPTLASAARAEADRLVAAARAGDWPPSIVAEWTLERARARLTLS